MSCAQCKGIEKEFDTQVAKGDLETYRRKGVSKTTRILIRELKNRGVSGATLLDIGGGVGAIQYELLKKGLERAIHVDASSAYLQTAKNEAQRLGLDDRINYFHGDYVALDESIPDVDIVTLDRVICCYDDMHALVEKSSSKAKRYYALVYPRDTWWLKFLEGIFNFFNRLRKRSFRIFIHANDEVEKILGEQGLERTYHRKNLIWQVALYTRSS
ncbi:MAG: methyltransferase domain-containing protein [Anaerolineales bacterium]|jgi:magnesium-protoporphyrin O-methyltransferase